MARPLRLEFPGATYHVTSRGDRREPVYRDAADRSAHLQVIGAAIDRFEAQVLAYCLMGIQCHQDAHTPQAILVDTDAYLMGLCRHVERNPVAAGLVTAPGDWAWSSYHAHVGRADAPPWLDTAALRMARVEGGPSKSSLAREIGLSVSRVSRLIAGAEETAVLGEAIVKT